MSGAHQSVLQQIGFAGPPDDPFHGPPIKRNLPATTDDTSENESFHAALPKGHEQYTLKDGDFIYNTRNTPTLVGKCTVYHGESGKYLFNNNILRIRFKNDLIPDFVNHYLNSEAGKAKIRRLVSGTTSVAAIYQNNFETITIPLPPSSVQLTLILEIEAEQKIVNGNKKLIEIFQKKISATIPALWA